MRARWAWCAEAVTVAIGAWLLLALSHAPAHLDTARDLLLARDLDEGAGRLSGPPTSFASLAQGAAWIHALAGARRAGLHVATIEQAVRALLALSTVGVWAMARAQGAGRAAVFASTATHAVVAPLLVGFPLLWNPSLAPLAAVAFFAALRRSVQRTSALTVGLGAIALALLVDLHVVAVLLLPALLAMGFAGRRALEGLVVAAASAGLAASVLWLSSGDAIAQDLGVAAQHPGPAAVAVGATLALTGALAMRWRGPVSPDRATVEAAAALAVLLVAGSVVAGRAASARYWAPIAPALCLAVGHALGVLKGRLALGARVALGVTLAASAVGRVAPVDPAPAWRLDEVERCAAALAPAGWTGYAARRSLDAPGGATFVSTLGAFLPLGTPDDERARLLVRPSAGSCIEVAPVVDVARGKRCIADACVALTLDPGGNPVDTGFAALAYPRRWELAPPVPPGPHRVGYVLPLMPGAASSVTAQGDAHTRWTATRRDRAINVTADVEQPWDDDGFPPAVLPGGPPTSGSTR